jgi:hypothetical protein
MLISYSTTFGVYRMLRHSILALHSPAVRQIDCAFFHCFYIAYLELQWLGLSLYYICMLAFQRSGVDLSVLFGVGMFLLSISSLSLQLLAYLPIIYLPTYGLHCRPATRA